MADIGPAEIFSTLRSPEAVRRSRDEGSIPWWTPDGFRLGFLRYLTVASHWIDYHLWPGSPMAMHAHSLLWFGVLVAAAALLYRDVTGAGPAAGLAALLYAVDDAHAVPAAWLANRNALLAAVFGFLCVLAHHRWRVRRSLAAAILSPILMTLALLSGEAATATMGYLVAHALFLEEGRLPRRLLALLPTAAVLACWGLAYHHFGFGSAGSGMYIDPLDRPMAFGRAFVGRAPLLLLGQWSPVPAEAGIFLSRRVGEGLWWAAAAMIVILGSAFAPLIRRSRAARFWCAGMMLSLVPIAATLPSNRLLLFAGLGAMGLLGEWMAGLRGAATWVPSGRRWLLPARALLLAMGVVHLVLAPLSFPIASGILPWMGDPMVKAAGSVPDDPSIEDQALVVVDTPDYFFFVSNVPVIKMLEGKPFPRSLRALTAGPVAIRVTREDARTLRTRVEGSFFSGLLGRLFRDEAHPLAAGDTVSLTGFTATVLAAGPSGAPEEMRYRFSVPLEDASLRWVRWDGGRYVPFDLPPIGATVTLPAARGPFESWPFFE